MGKLYGYFKREKKSLMRWPGHCKKEEISKEKLIIHKYQHKINTSGQIISKQKLMTCRRIAIVTLFSDWDETVNCLNSRWSKLAQKEYKRRYDWVERVIYWELYKRLKFDHADQCYIPKPKYFLKNETQRIFWNFWDIMGSLISLLHDNKHSYLSIYLSTWMYVSGSCVSSWMGSQRRDIWHFWPASDCLEESICLFWHEDHKKSCDRVYNAKPEERTKDVGS